jgi:hypothetical protein
MSAHDDDRPKKSWREIDAGKNKSNHRSGGGGTKPDRMANSQAYRSYKTQLNKLFDGGAELPDALKEKLQDSGMVEAAKAKKAATQIVLDAMSPRKLHKAFKAYRAEYGLPEEREMLNKLLESDDEDLLVEIFGAIERLVGEGELKAGSAMQARIKSALILVDAPEVQTLGTALLKKLR